MRIYLHGNMCVQKSGIRMPLSTLLGYPVHDVRSVLFRDTEFAHAHTRFRVSVHTYNHVLVVV